MPAIQTLRSWGRKDGFKGSPQLQSKFQDSLGYLGPCVKEKTKCIATTPVCDGLQL